jgi:uncharacterized membrane protein YgdD (TMEM256/DUF423 family)
MVDPVEVLIAAPTASHTIVSGPRGLYCRKCGETKDFKTTCVPAEAECAAAFALELAKINATATENEAQRASAHALELVKINAKLNAAHALELVRINATATENEAQRSSAHALEVAKINATATENDAQRASSHALELVKINAKLNAAHALELVRIKAAAKENFARNATSVLIGCLALAVVSFFSREVAWWVKASVVPLLNSAREKLLALIGGVVGFVTGQYFRR